ncbi:MAG TPA: tetratricopeptide repeat protein, partial [Panacibacter sp.]|nr:tetratricopeptide repeat protein [Panacibacter sp.]
MSNHNSAALFFILLLCCFTFSENSKAQTAKNNDSTFNEISKMKDDTVKIKLLFDLGYTLEETDTTLCNKVYSEAIIISKRIGNILYECKSLINKGILNITHGNYDAARLFYQQAYQLAVKIKNDPYSGKTLGNIGNTYLYQDKYEDALKYYLEGIKYIEKTNDLLALSLSYSNVAVVFDYQHLYDKEMIYCNKALETALALNDTNTIGVSYVNLSLAYLHKKDSLKSYEISQKALVYLRNSPYNIQLATAFQNVSSGYKDMKEYTKAMSYCDSALQLFLTSGSSNDIASALTLKSIIAMRQKDLVTARRIIESAKKYVADDGSWLLWREWNLQMSNLEEAGGNYKDALYYYEAMQVYADSLNNQDLQKNNLSLEARYQSEKKQSQIVQLEKEKELQSLSIKQKNTFNALLGIGLLAAGIIGFLFYRNTKRKQQLSAQTQLIQQQQITQLEQEKQLVATTSILLGQEAERNRMAKDLHDGLGGMLSGIKLNLSSMQGNMIVHEKDVQLFSKSILQLDNAITEMRRVAHNMMPEALLKFGLSEAIQDYCDGINESNSVKMKFTQLGLQQPLDKPTEVILYRIVQELSNNAIKHA